MHSWHPSAHGLTAVPLGARLALADAANRLAREPAEQREHRCAQALCELFPVDECLIDHQAPAWALEAFATRTSGVVVHEERAVAVFLAPAAHGAGLVLQITRAHQSLGELDLHLLQLFALQMLPALAEGRFFLLTHLSRRKAEVLSLLASSVDTPHACRSMDISRNTFHTHLRHLYRCFGVQSRSELLHIRAIREAFSLPVTKADATGLLELTPRQRQIVEHLIAGSSEKEVAASLSISPHTVHDSMKRVHRRLGVCSRAELIMAVETAAVMPDPP